MRLLKYILPVLLCASLLGAYGQDAQFSQYYAAPLYHNPAFAGTEYANRIMLNYRNQWPSIPGAFTTTAASFDTYAPRLNGGAGLMLSHDVAGISQFTSTTARLVYAYHTAFTRKWNGSFGIGAGIQSRSNNFNNLVFGDQLSATGQINPSTDPLANTSQSSTTPDLTIGGLLFSKDLYFGFSAANLITPSVRNQPQGSITQPLRLTFNAGIEIPIEDPRYLKRGQRYRTVTPSILYRTQGGFNQLDLGVQAGLWPLVLGAYYRGLPLISSKEGIYNQDALVFMAGFNFNDIQFGYSYDLNISRLVSAINGSHEISLSYRWDTPQKNKKKRYRRIPCPSF